VQVAGALSLGGTLTVTNLGPDLAPGDVFPLFAAGAFSGSFSAVTLPDLQPGLRWDTNQLTSAGTIAVVAVPAPLIQPVTVIATNLTLQFLTQTNVAYVLQATTNLEPPVAWTSLQTNAGDGAVLTLQLSVDPAQPQQYYQVLAY
jgi:hypothetical protein